MLLKRIILLWLLNIFDGSACLVRAKMPESTIFSLDAQNAEPTIRTMKSDFLLPNDVKPTHYNLSLRPDRPNLSFIANVEIQLQVLKRTNTIVLHSQDLDLAEVSVESPSHM